MPCQSDWGDDKDYLQSQVNNLSHENGKNKELIKRMKDDIDLMTRSFCKITNLLYDYDPELLAKFLMSDEELLEVFQKHQRVDKQQGRSYIQFEMKPTIQRMDPKPIRWEDIDPSDRLQVLERKE
jgi:hypothetical protein|nr:MAG TPA: hypothetical protein [Caudoviricetes sp.]